MGVLVGDTNRKVFREKKFTITSPVASNMSLASVHPAELHSSHSSLTTLSHSLDDITGLSWNSPYHTIHSDHVMTIEELRNQMSSCFTCGVSWTDDHVSLDCSECGGYAMERPCPICDGNCGVMWKRDLTKTHATSKARWLGECKLSRGQTIQEPANTLIAQELCSRLEKLSANS
ncbi:hypothetical protein QE152_g25415 [Popillia japonica]|uniref:Protein pinocchio n=1 Tax=Popillia japonica TaxID=7064 RepID=A0AAW1K0T2_POPJA